MRPHSHYEMSRVHSSLHSCLRGIGIWCSGFSCHTALVHLPVDLEKTDLDSQQTSQLPLVIINRGVWVSNGSDWDPLRVPSMHSRPLDSLSMSGVNCKKLEWETKPLALNAEGPGNFTKSRPSETVNFMTCPGHSVLALRSSSCNSLAKNRDNTTAIENLSAPPFFLCLPHWEKFCCRTAAGLIRLS